MKLKKAPNGSCWRIELKQPQVDTSSNNYQALENDRVSFEPGNILDEVVIIFAPRRGDTIEQRNNMTFHLEQMGNSDWYLGIGDHKLNIHIKPDRSLELSHYDGPDIKDNR